MRYRAEIDGLRAVAVVPVILFHAGLGVLDGGFVGVDVFFVISGYLITTILLDDLAAGRLSIARFYERRARRILPALTVVMAVCVPFAWALMDPFQFEEFGHSLAATGLFVSNVLFWMQSGYFEAAAEEKPLLHTWSLAVEEQYYLLFPLILMLAWRSGRSRALLVVWVMAAASLAAAEIGWRLAPSANFFLAPGRMWELLAGSLCAFALQGRGPWRSEVGAAAGLALVFGAMIAFDADTPFPSIWTLAPVGGTALIILCAGPGTWTARLLSLRAFTAIGLVSYSAYLWHQPLFAFARLSTEGAPPPWLMAALMPVTLALAWVSWRFVEQPFRRGPRPALPTRRAVFAASGAVTAGFVGVGLLADNTAAFEAGLTPLQRERAAYADYRATPDFAAQFRRDVCHIVSTSGGFGAYDQALCLRRDPARRNILLMGDSHGAHLYGPLSVAFADVNILQANASGCRPLLPLKGETRCTALARHVIEQVLPAGGIDGVVLAARWEPGEEAAFAETVRVLRGLTPEVVVFGPVPEYRTPAALMLARAAEDEDLDTYAAGHLEAATFARAAAVGPAAVAAGARYVDVLGALCPGGVCRALGDGGAPMTFDKTHFTADGARTLLRLLIEDGFAL